MSVKLSAAALGRLPAGVAAPGYDRAELSAGILHIGVGNFHRAHQAVYLDDLFASGRDHDWAIVGAGVREYDFDMRAKLAAQDWLTTVVEQEANATTVAGDRTDDRLRQAVRRRDDARNVGAAGDPHRVADGHRRRLLHRSGDADVRPAPPRDRLRRGAFRRAEVGLRPDRRRPQAPARRRRRAVHCHVVRQHSRQRPRLRERRRRSRALVDPELAAWIRANVAFPNSMVDRITPATSDRERAILKDQYGVEDNWPVFCEAVPPVGGRGPLPRWAAGAGDGRRDLRRRRRALRADEDPHPQRRPCGDRLSGRAARHPLRP